MIDFTAIFLIILFTLIVNIYAADDNGKQCVKYGANVNNNSIVIDWFKVENETKITRCDWIISVKLDKSIERENLKETNDSWYLKAYQSSKNLKLYLQSNYKVPNFESEIKIPHTLIKNGIIYDAEVRYFDERKLIATACYELNNHLAYNESIDIQNPKIYLIGAEKSFCEYDLIINAEIIGNISNSVEIQWKIKEQYRNEIVILPTRGTFILLEANSLRCGQKYEIICELMLEMQILATETHTVNVLKPKILLSLQTGNQSVGINQTIQINANIEVPNDLYYKALWKCTTKETEDCGQFEDNNGTLLIENGFSEKGLYEFELIVSGIGEHDPLKTFVKVVMGAGSIHMEKIPTFIDISNSFEIVAEITNLITGCFISLQSINDTNYQTFNVSQILHYNGIFLVTVRRDAFLRELAPFSKTRTTEEYSFIIPGNILKTTRDATYYLVIHVQCKVPGVMDNSFYAGLLFTTNAPPKVGDFNISPQSGDALSTIFTFETNQASDKYMDHPILYEFGWKYKNRTIYFTKMQEFYIYQTYLPFTGEGLQTVAKICDPQNACNEIDGPVINIEFEGLNDYNYGTMQTRLTNNLFRDDYQKFQADALGFLISCKEGRFEKLYDNVTYTINAMLIKKSGMLQGRGMDKRTIHGFITTLTLLENELKIDERLLKNIQRLRGKLIDEQIHSSIVTDDEREALGVIDKMNNRDNTTLEDIKKYFEATQFIIMTANDTNMVEMERENFINNLEKHLKHVCSLLYSRNLNRKSFDLPSGFIVVEKFKSAYFNSFSYVPNIENQWQQYIEIKFDRSWFLETRGQSLCTAKVLLYKYMNTNFVYYTHVLHGKDLEKTFPNDKKVIIRKRIQNAKDMKCYFKDGNNWVACTPGKTSITSTRITCECNHLGFYKISNTSADDFTPITDSNNVEEPTTAMSKDSTTQSTITTVITTKAATEQVTNDNDNDNQTKLTQSATPGRDSDDRTTTTIQTIPMVTTEGIPTEFSQTTMESRNSVSNDQVTNDPNNQTTLEQSSTIGSDNNNRTTTTIQTIPMITTEGILTGFSQTTMESGVSVSNDQVTNDRDNQTTLKQSSTIGSDNDDRTTTTVQTIPMVTTEGILTEFSQTTMESAVSVSNNRQTTSENNINEQSTAPAGVSTPSMTLLTTNIIDQTDLTTPQAEIPSLTTVNSISETPISSPETTMNHETPFNDITDVPTIQSTIATDITITLSNSIAPSNNNDDENTSKDQKLSSDNLTTRSMNTDIIMTTAIMDGYDTEGNKNTGTVSSTSSLLTTTLQQGVEDHSYSTFANTPQNMETTTNFEARPDTQTMQLITDSNVRTSTFGFTETTLLTTNTVKDATNINQSEGTITDSITENVQSTTESSIRLSSNPGMDSLTSRVTAINTNTETTFEATVNSPTVRSIDPITTPGEEITKTVRDTTDVNNSYKTITDSVTESIQSSTESTIPSSTSPVVDGSTNRITATDANGEITFPTTINSSTVGSDGPTITMDRETITTIESTTNINQFLTTISTSETENNETKNSQTETMIDTTISTLSTDMNTKSDTPRNIATDSNNYTIETINDATTLYNINDVTTETNELSSKNVESTLSTEINTNVRISVTMNNLPTESIIDITTSTETSGITTITTLNQFSSTVRSNSETVEGITTSTIDSDANTRISTTESNNIASGSTIDVSVDTSDGITIKPLNPFSSSITTNSETPETITTSTIDSNLNSRTSTNDPNNIATRTTITYDTTNNDLTTLTTSSNVSPSITDSITNTMETKSTLNTNTIDSDTTLTVFESSNSFKTTVEDSNLDITTTQRSTLMDSVSENHTTDHTTITTNSQSTETTTMGTSPYVSVIPTEDEQSPSTVLRTQTTIVDHTTITTNSQSTETTTMGTSPSTSAIPTEDELSNTGLSNQSTLKDQGTETGSTAIESSEVSTTLASNQIESTQTKSTISASTDKNQLMSTKKITDGVITSASSTDSSKPEISTNSDNTPSAVETSTVNTIKSAGLVNASSLSLSDKVSYIVTGLSIAGIVGLIASSAIIKRLKRQRSIDTETNAPFNMYSGDIVEPENMDNFPVLR